MAGILIYKAREALTKDYRKTEMWLYSTRISAPGSLRPVGERHRLCAIPT